MYVYIYILYIICIERETEEFVAHFSFVSYGVHITIAYPTITGANGTATKHHIVHYFRQSFPEPEAESVATVWKRCEPPTISPNV